jgi:thiopurine S-methyltransferase
MDPDFWRARWAEGKIGFHEGRPNAHLEAHASRLGERRTVLVPLCGKSADLAYLAARGHHVVGVELVESAARAFFAEHGLTPEESTRGGLTALSAGEITILVGDFFATTRELLGPVDALYDRAAMIALPPPLRARYVQHLRKLLPVGAPGLLLVLEYPQDQMAGPPFSVMEDEVRALYAGATVETIVDESAIGGGGVARLRELGVASRARGYALRF